MPILYGVSPSPYVRKAMLALAYKEISHEFKLTMPSADDEAFRQASPTGKVPAFCTDDGAGFADSSVIIAYLERISTNKPLYPEDSSDFAKALWLEEYSDAEMMPAIGALYFQRVVGPKFFNHTTEPQRVDELITKVIPPVLDVVESRLADNGWLIGNSFSVADIGVGSCLINLLHADYLIDEQRWPKLFAYNERFLNLDIVKAQLENERAVFSHVGS